jgi:nitrate/nitrite transporter NarK
MCGCASRAVGLCSSDRQASKTRARALFPSSCMVGTIVMVSLTRQWIEVAFFASFFFLGLLRWSVRRSALRTIPMESGERPAESGRKVAGGR